MRLSLSKTQLKKDLKGTIALIAFCFFLFGIRYTDDWYGYYHFFNDPEASPDLLFKYLAIYFKNNGFSYIDLFQLHILAIGFCLSYFITRFSSYPILILFCILLVRFIPIVNQIRYYLAFGFFLISIYYFFISKNRKKTIPLLFLAGLSHLAIIPLFTIFLIFPRIKKYSLKKLSNALIITSVIMVIIFHFITKLISGHFKVYTHGESISSIIGGLYLIIPIMLVYIYIFCYHKIICEKIPAIKEDIKFNFLFILSVYTAPVLLIGVVSQIIVHRYVSIFSMVWLIYLIYPLSLEPSRRQFIFIRFFGLLSFLIILIYLAPIVIFGENEFIMKAILTLQSIENIKI